MRRWTLFGLALMAVGLMLGCGILGGGSEGLSKTGNTISTIGAAATGVNPLVGLVLTLLGGGLTAVGEYKKTAEGR